MSWIEALKKNPWITIFLFFGIILREIIIVLKGFDWLWKRFRPKPTLSKEQLSKKTTQLLTELSDYKYQRQYNAPLLIDLNGLNEVEKNKKWREHGDELIKYSQETMSLYQIQFLERITKIREEFKRRNIIHEELERIYKLPVNLFGLDMIIAALAEMNSRL